MATILEFRPREACQNARAGDQGDPCADAGADLEAASLGASSRQARRQTTCDILFFTGVRYSRDEDMPPCPTATVGAGMDEASTRP